MLIVPFGGWETPKTLAVLYVQIVCVGTRQNVSCVIVGCVTAPLIAVVAGYFLVNVAIHNAFVFVVCDAKVSIISVTPKIILPF